MKVLLMMLALASQLVLASPSKNTIPLLMEYHSNQSEFVATIFSDRAVLEWNTGQDIRLEKIVLNGQVICSVSDGIRCAFDPHSRGLVYAIGTRPLTAQDAITVVVKFNDEYNSRTVLTRVFVKPSGFAFGQSIFL